MKTIKPFLPFVCGRPRAVLSRPMRNSGWSYSGSVVAD